MMHHRPGNAGASDRSNRAGKIVRLFKRFGNLGMRFFGERRGNVVIVFGVALTVIVGAVGLGTDAASWYATKRAMQNAADLAAAGAINALKSYYPCTTNCTAKAGYAKNEGKSAAAWHGYVDGTGGTAVNIQVKAVDSAIYSSANYTAAPDYGAAEVVVTQPAPLHFASLFMTSSPTIVARSLTRINPSTGDCMLALNPSAPMAFNLQGTAVVNVSCGVQVNSTSNDALDLQGNVHLTAGSIQVAGAVGTTGNSFTMNPGTAAKGTISDPYAARTLPTTVSGTFTASGTYTGGGLINGDVNVSGTLELDNGVYIINNGNLNVSNATLRTSGATIVLTGSSSNNIGVLNCTSNCVLNLLSPSATVGDPGYSVTQTYPDVAGIALYQDRNANESTLKGNGACQSNQSTVGSNAVVTVNGAFYMPKSCVYWGGGPATTQCFQIVSDTIVLEGNPGINVSSCTQGEALFGPTTVSMTE